MFGFLNRFHSKSVIAFSILLFIASRLYVFYSLKIEPDPLNLTSHHIHHLPLENLSKDLLVSIINLHSQPPLWNLIIGISAKACDSGIECTVNVLHLLNIALSIGIFFMLRDLLIHFLRKKTLSTAMSILFCISPAVIFYENYIFYQHLTLFLTTLLCWGAFKFIVKNNDLGGILSCISLVGLSWILTIFHPVFVGLLISVICLSALNPANRNLCIFLITATLLASSLPSFKNLIKFDFFSGSSWVGLNLSQVAPTIAEGCEFPSFRSRFPDNMHLGLIFNDNSIIPLSKRCRDEAVASIMAHPVAYAYSFVWRTYGSLTLWPSSYCCYHPINWKHFPIDTTRVIVRNSNGHVDIRSMIIRILTVSFSGACISACLYLTHYGHQCQRKFFVFCSIYVGLFLFIIHATNGGEQERMRYTIDIILWLSLIVAVDACLRILFARYCGKLLPSSGNES